jgi:hypothetical protein
MNVYNITIYEGALYRLRIDIEQKDLAGNVTPFNLTGYNVRAQLRPNYDSSRKWDFTVTIDDIANGYVTISLPATVTQTIPEGDYVYDVEVFSTSDTAVVYRVVYGTAEVIAEVTQ